MTTPAPTRRLRRRVAAAVLSSAAAPAMIGGATLSAGDAHAGYTQTFGPDGSQARCVAARMSNTAWINKSSCFSSGPYRWYYRAQHI